MNENIKLLAEIKLAFDNNIKWGEENKQSAIEVLGDLIYDLQKIEEASIQCEES